MQTNRMILFRRVEHKYYVDRTTKTALERDLRSFMQPDQFTGSSEGYMVRSIYFDTPDYRSYHDKMNGVAIRHKLRMRAYGNQPQNAPFIRLEIKSRYMNIINKITVDVPKDMFPEVEFAIRNHRLPPPSFFNNGEISREFFRIQRQYNMVPQILVQYRRRAYEKTEINRVRVNFDEELMASKNLDLMAPMQGARSLLKYDHAIFEIKVDGTMPFWLHKLIGKYDLQNQAISKFCNSIRGQARLSTIAREYE